MMKKIAAVVLFTTTILSVNAANALDTVTAALTSKAFQYVPLVIAQERGYMREEGLELKLVFMQNAPGLQALIANAVQFSGSGSSALVAISKGNAPLKTILAFNDQVSAVDRRPAQHQNPARFDRQKGRHAPASRRSPHTCLEIS